MPLYTISINRRKAVNVASVVPIAAVVGKLRIAPAVVHPALAVITKPKRNNIKTSPIHKKTENVMTLNVYVVCLLYCSSSFNAGFSEFLL